MPLRSAGASRESNDLGHQPAHLQKRQPNHACKNAHARSPSLFDSVSLYGYAGVTA